MKVITECTELNCTIKFMPIKKFGCAENFTRKNMLSFCTVNDGMTVIIPETGR